ncbi:flippase-like domain-containing protein [Candidatus Acetothermia bacterium]|nr:flippase-like domain-containing protein [Candidatus Acetothermia bacterium]MCI2427392.1 flippase-like domain-containing protein [Candidatus Acetothermia bacterium]MCI2428779.1 flippase-like domain-containing protein [Candidatus Acetothermia bacterium]
MKHTRRTILIATILGISLLAVILHIAGPRAILLRMAALGLWGALVFIINAGLIFLCTTLGWTVLLRAYGVQCRIRSVFGAMAAGHMVSYLTPSLYFGGEPVRAALMSRGFSSQSHVIVATIVVERLLAMTSSVVIIFIGSIVGLQSDMSFFLRWMLFAVATLAVLITFFLIVGVISKRRGLSATFRYIQRFLPPREWKQKAVDALTRVESEIHNAFTNYLRGTAMAALFLAAATLLTAALPFVFVYFTYGRILSLGEIALFFALHMLFGALFWITPAGIGMAEGFFTGIFNILGIPADGAVAFSFALRLIDVVIITNGLAYIAHRGMNWLDILWRKSRAVQASWKKDERVKGQTQGRSNETDLHADQ